MISQQSDIQSITMYIGIFVRRLNPSLRSIPGRRKCSRLRCFLVLLFRCSRDLYPPHLFVAQQVSPALDQKYPKILGKLPLIHTATWAGIQIDKHVRPFYHIQPLVQEGDGQVGNPLPGSHQRSICFVAAETVASQIRMKCRHISDGRVSSGEGQ